MRLLSRRPLAVSICVLAILLTATLAKAGTFLFANEANGVDIVTHPKGYAGAGGTYAISVCIDPTSANAADMEVSVQNAVNVLRRLEPVTSNVLSGSNNELAGGDMDFESTILHELGHCIGLAHPNLATESGLAGANRNYTQATQGNNNKWDLGVGNDNIRGSKDDDRADDVNLHWFRISNNNPFTMDATTFDASTYSRDLGDLPSGHDYAANGDRAVAVSLGISGQTEVVMQQGAFFDEAQRELVHDDVAMLRFAMSGVDEVQGNADDYTIDLTYGGITSGCDINIDFDDAMTSFAVCGAGGVFIGGGHVSVTTADIYFDPGYNWFFNEALTHCGNGELDDGEVCDDGDLDAGDGCDSQCVEEPFYDCTGEPSVCTLQPGCGNGALDGGEDCDDGNNTNGDCCAADCSFEAALTDCSAADICTTGDSCDGAGVCAGGTPIDCDDGLFCDGPETCDPIVGCQSNSPIDPDDGVSCTTDACDEGLDLVINTPDDGLCDDGLWCNGDESCDAFLDCLPGTPVDVDDGVACTDDTCDDGIDEVVNSPNHGSCEDGVFCNGVEVCDALTGCKAGPPLLVDDEVACTYVACSEFWQFVAQVPDHSFCEDGDPCTRDVCDLSLGCQSNPADICQAVPTMDSRLLWLMGLAMLATGGWALAGRGGASQSKRPEC